MPLLNTEVHWFALWVVVGVLTAVFTTQHLLQYLDTSTNQPAKHPKPTEQLWKSMGTVLLSGLLGARLYHILLPPPSLEAVGISTVADYLSNLYQLLNFRDGGLEFFGALGAGFVFLYALVGKRPLRFFAWADTVVIGTALGQAVGVWGLFFSQSVYGTPSNLPWAIDIDPVYRLPQYAAVDTFHPVFLYLSLWQFGLFVLLYWLLQQRGAWFWNGGGTAVYLIGYGLGRFLIETVRLNSPQILFGTEPLSVTYLISLGLIGVGALLLWLTTARHINIKT